MQNFPVTPPPHHPQTGSDLLLLELSQASAGGVGVVVWGGQLVTHRHLSVISITMMIYEPSDLDEVLRSTLVASDPPCCRQTAAV